MSEPQPIIRCRGLTVGYGREAVLRGVELEVPRGAFLPFVGPNGAGKTTLLRAILGLLRPLAGTIETPFRRSPPGYVPQQKAIDPLYPLSAEQIALMGLYPRLGWWRRPTAADRKLLDAVFEELGLSPHRRKTYGELSGGTKQKTLIARAFLSGAEVFIMDEPTSELDEASEDGVLGHLARLSRFAEGSDIWRINRLRAGEATFVHHDTLECLRIAEQVRLATAGAFDVAYATLLPPAKATGKMPVPPGSESSGGTGFQPVRPSAPLLALDEASHTVRVLGEGVRLDLGGIGKGFALDRMAALLREWETASALLAASTSTLLALDPPPDEAGWPVEFGPDDAPQRLLLANQALSASGLGARGSHVVDPRTGRPASSRRRAWAIAPTAALADALSTAFLVMTDAEIRTCRGRCPTAIPHVFPACVEASPLPRLAPRPAG